MTSNSREDPGYKCESLEPDNKTKSPCSVPPPCPPMEQKKQPEEPKCKSDKGEKKGDSPCKKETKPCDKNPPKPCEKKL